MIRAGFRGGRQKWNCRVINREYNLRRWAEDESYRAAHTARSVYGQRKLRLARRIQDKRSRIESLEQELSEYEQEVTRRNAEVSDD